MSLKKQYRDLILASKKQDSIPFTMGEMELAFKRPTRKDRREIMALSKAEDGSIDHAQFETWTAIKLTTVASTGETLFDEVDFNTIENLEIGSKFDELCAEAVLAMLGGLNDPKELPES